MIYLDFNATNPLRPQVRAAMEDLLGEIFGNPSSVHSAGRLAREKIEQARGTCLRALGDPSGQLIFTSGGTEADNLALTGVAHSFSSKGNHLIISAVEHHAVLHPAQALIKEGIDLTIIPVNDVGRVNVQEIQRAISPRTILISIMHANNEVGTIQPISEIAHMAHSKGILFHTDAVQSFGKISVNARDLQVDMASISAHKIGGPKGSGALYVRRGIKISPLLYGGPHERNMRAGTENVPGIVGMGAAVELAVKEKENGRLRGIQQLRDHLENGLKKQISDIQVNGDPQDRLPNTSNVSFLGCHGETLLMALDVAGICVSTGSACSSGSTEPSHVLAAMGLSPEQINGSIRFSLGWATTEADIEDVLRHIPLIVKRVRKAGVT